MDIIEKARELGRLIQEEDSYKKLQDAQNNADADMELQRLIGEFNLKRMSINNEASKKERDQEKLSKLPHFPKVCQFLRQNILQKILQAGYGIHIFLQAHLQAFLFHCKIRYLRT